MASTDDASEESSDVSERVRRLRDALRLSQGDVASASGQEKWTRVHIAKFENGQNKASSYEAIEGLARAFGLSRDNLKRYLAGEFGLEDALERRGVPDEAETSGETAAGNLSGYAEAEVAAKSRSAYPTWVFEKARRVKNLLAEGDVTPEAVLDLCSYVMRHTTADEARARNAEAFDKRIKAMQSRKPRTKKT